MYCKYPIIPLSQIQCSEGIHKHTVNLKQPGEYLTIHKINRKWFMVEVLDRFNGEWVSCKLEPTFKKAREIAYKMANERLCAEY